MNRDSETFHDNILFTIATDAIAKIHIYYKNVSFFKYRQIIFERQTILFAQIVILTFLIIVFSQSKVVASLSGYPPLPLKGHTHLAIVVGSAVESAVESAIGGRF